MKKSVILTAVVAVIAVLAVAGFVFRDDIAHLINPAVTTEPAEPLNPTSTDPEAYRVLEAAKTDSALPMLETTLENVYYTMALDGTVTFYELEGTAFNQLPASGEYTVSVNCSNQDIPATVYYYTDSEGRTAGYGLFTAEMDSAADVYVYDYAFFRLMDLPESFASADKALLLVDTNKEDMFSNDKVYEESFYFNKKDSSASSRLLSNDNRTFDDRGAQRADYAMVTEDAVLDCAKELYFFSSRHYHLYDVGSMLDLFISGSSTWNNTDNNRLVEQISDFYARNTDDGVLCLINTETGFTLSLYNADENGPKTIKEFDGGFTENYLRCGDWLLDRRTLEAYNLYTQESLTLSVAGTDSFVPDVFEISDSGDVFMRGVSNATAAIAAGSTDGCVCYQNAKFANIVSPSLDGAGRVVFSLAESPDGSAYSVNIYNLSAQGAAAATEEGTTGGQQ